MSVKINNIIQTKGDLKDFLESDSRNYQSQRLSFLKRWKRQLYSNPISEQKYIWRYIYALRHVEYYQNNSNNMLCKIMLLWWLRKLRKYSHVTSFQIPPHICGKGLTIWHWGPIIVNGSAKIGDNCTLYPGVLIGQKNSKEDAAIIGNNVFIGAGTKIIGHVKIGNNVTLGQNLIITKDIPDNTVIVANNINRMLYHKS